MDPVGLCDPTGIFQDFGMCGVFKGVRAYALEGRVGN